MERNEKPPRGVIHTIRHVASCKKEVAQAEEIGWNSKWPKWNFPLEVFCFIRSRLRWQEAEVFAHESFCDSCWEYFHFDFYRHESKLSMKSTENAARLWTMAPLSARLVAGPEKKIYRCWTEQQKNRTLGALNIPWLEQWGKNDKELEQNGIKSAIIKHSNRTGIESAFKLRKNQIGFLRFDIAVSGIGGTLATKVIES